MWKIVVWLSASSRVSWLQVWKEMHIWPSLPISTCWWWEETQRREVEKRRYSRSSCYSEGKKSPRLCISKLRSNEFCSTESWRNWDWTLRWDTPWNSQDAPGTKLKFGKGKGNLEALSKKMNLMSEILARPVLRNEHLRKPHDKKLVPAKQRGIWLEKYTSSKLKIKLRFILLWRKRRQKHRRSYVCCGFGSFNAHAEQVVWSSDQMDTLRRSRTPRAVLTATGEVQINEEAQVFLFMISICS